MRPLSAIRYRGGKSGISRTGVGRWVAAQIPFDPRGLYCEPFAGMAGVLLQRPASRCEVLNDLDGHVHRWWKAVRADHAELQRLLDNTPNGREAYAEAHATMDDPSASDTRRAAAFTVAMLQSHPARRGVEGAWYDNGRSPGIWGAWRYGLTDRLPLLADRLRNVVLENRDAIDLLADLAHRADAVVYADPPYMETMGYEHDVDREALREALLAQTGQVAVSGYGDEWDGLGWRRESRPSRLSHAGLSNVPDAERTESLWMNYPPVNPRLL